MKSIFNKLLIITIIIMICILDIIFFLAPKKTFSYEENKMLAKFSINNYEDFFQDHFPVRLHFIKIKNIFEKVIGKTYINGVYLGKDNYLIPSFTPNSKREYLIETINEFTKKYPQTDLMIVPDSILINADKLYFHKNEDEDREIDYLYRNIIANKIDLRTIFKEKNKINDIYYKTDHHWTSYGAYIAYSYYMEQKEIVPLKENDYQRTLLSDSFLGTSSSKALGLAKKENIYLYDYHNNLLVNYVFEGKQVNSLYNYDYIDKKDKYALFLDNNHPLIEITNNSLKNNKSIIVIKNSYANAFIPFIVNHYQKTYVIDLRYYSNNVSDFIRTNAIEDILILYNLNNLYSDMSLIRLK